MSPLKLFRSAPELYISTIQFYKFKPEANTFTPVDGRAAFSFCPGIGVCKFLAKKQKYMEV